MTQKEKQLLLKDLCARLPYGIVINIGDKDLKLDRKYQCIGVLYPEDCSDEFNERNNNASFYITISGCYYGEEIKPYLRPMSSMTEEEVKEYHNLCHEEERECYEFGEWTTRIYFHDTIDSIDWLLSHHFDFRGLIGEGIALEAPEDMYKTE